MKLLKALILICLLGGDRGPDPASLEAFPLAARGCDGRANILCVPAAYPVLLYRGHFSVESTLLAGVLLTMIGLLRHSTDLGRPISTVLIEMTSKCRGTRIPAVVSACCSVVRNRVMSFSTWQGIYATYRRNVDGILTLMGSLSDESLSPSTNPDGHSVVHVNLKCPSGVMQPITLKYSCNVLSVVLFKEVEKIIGVPTSLQMLTYGMHFLRPDVPLNHYQLQDGCIINLSVRGVGGAGSDTESDDEGDVSDECESCGERADVYCVDCHSSRCHLCNEQWHKHPKRKHHQTKVVKQQGIDSTEDQDDYGMDDYDDIFNSPSVEESFQQATLIATLAEKFGMTSFKPFQKNVISATLDGRDTLVIHPTGSGKSLCFQFPPVYQNKKAIVVTPTISLMQDQVHALNSKGIPCVLVGSAQVDKQVEMHALEPDSKELLIFVTPEWMTKPANQAKLHTLVRANQLSLIAIDEAHLFTEWSEFRTAFSDLRNIKSHFPSIPIMCLTATATPAVEEDIKLLLRNPFVQKMSMNRPNVTLNVEELKEDKSLNHAEQFAKRASEICGSSSSIVYTDFIADIGPIVSALQQVGVEAVGYHGEMDAPSRQESYLKWKSGQVQTIVATKAFGMGIDKPDIRHVIRSGVPESILSWAQELGRAGRDGQQACATILYRRSDISHANAWILNNLSNKERCRRILSNFSESWRFVNANLAGMCRRKLLLEMFGEESTSSTYTEDCCDVCMYEEHIDSDFKEELKVLIDAVDHLGGMGEVKIAEWIRGSKIAWTNGFDKNCLSYGNHKGKDMNFWRTFIRQCNVISLVQLELKSMIKGSGLYTVNGVYYVTPKGREALVESESLLLPDKSTDGKETSSATAQGGVSLENLQAKKKRLGKGSNILTTVRKLLSESENWFNIENKSNYQFPGVLPKPCFQQLFYTANLSSLAQSCEDPHFIWKDIQLSKGQLNRDRLISVEIHGKTEEVYYRSAPCLGVKICPRGGCNHVVPIRDKRNCPEHNIALEKTYDCPVVFVYMYPKSSADSRRWFGGIVRCQKAPAGNLHNHEIHAPSRIAQCIKEKITDAISANPALTPSEIACGKGLGFIPSAVDGASSHTGKVSQEIRKTKQRKGLMDKDWSPMNFEEVADTIDEEDNEISGDGSEKLKKYKRHGRPYLVAFGLEDGIKFIFTMSPIMTKVASEADFIQCDITYDSCKDYPYIFNVVAFDKVTMEWLVVARLRLDKQDSFAYGLAFKKLFDKCKSSCGDFELGSTLMGVVTDWSDAEINGLRMAVGKDTAEKLLKGCKVHWQRSCQRVADKVAKSKDRKREKFIFLKISSQIQKLDSSLGIVACFETLCGVRSVKQLLDILPTVCSVSDAVFVDTSCDWSSAKHWAQWWARCDHLKMLSKSFSMMEDKIWKQCPTTTNAVERRNKDCKGDVPQSLKLAMIKVYKLDKVACLKHISAEEGAGLSYRSRTEEARRMLAEKRQKQRMKSVPDKSSQFGPPDRSDNFVTGPSTSRKRADKSPQLDNAPKRLAVCVDNSTVQYIPNNHPEILGKRARMRFESESGKEEWYEGVISSYNGLTGKFGLYFPCDGKTEDASFDDEDMELID